MSVITNGRITTIVFDLGGVLVDWNPRYLFRKIFGANEAAMETFLTEVCNVAWNEQQDCGRTWDEAIAEAVKNHPTHELNIRAYRERWPEMLNGQIDGTVEILNELKNKPVRLLALTNWSAETFHIAEERFDFLQWFEDVLVSGREKLMKPDPAIFKLLTERYQLNPAQTVFIDDSKVNVDTASKLGLQALHFTGADKARSDLQHLGVL